MSPGNAALTVYVVDDDEPMRNALRRTFVDADLNVECFASAEEFLDSHSDRRHGCLLLDLAMPGMNGIDLQMALTERGIRMPIVFLTGTNDVGDAVQAMKGGAADFMQKPIDNAILVARIRLVLEGESGDVSILDNLDEVRARLATLTPREREVMRWVVMGNTNKMTGRKLGVSHRTVEIHRSRIMEKMEAASLPELVRMAMEAESGR